MERCGMHGCVLIIRKLAVGWGEESLKICPKCEEERKGFGCGSSSRVYFPTEKED